MRHLDTVDGDHPWSLMGGLILVVVSLCRRAGRKYFEDRFGRNYVVPFCVVNVTGRLC